MLCGFQQGYCLELLLFGKMRIAKFQGRFSFKLLANHFVGESFFSWPCIFIFPSWTVVENSAICGFETIILIDGPFFDCMWDDIDITFDVLCEKSMASKIYWFYGHLSYKFFCKRSLQGISKIIKNNLLSSGWHFYWSRLRDFTCRQTCTLSYDYKSFGFADFCGYLRLLLIFASPASLKICYHT